MPKLLLDAKAQFEAMTQPDTKSQLVRPWLSLRPSPNLGAKSQLEAKDSTYTAAQSSLVLLKILRPGALEPLYSRILEVEGLIYILT